MKMIMSRRNASNVFHCGPFPGDEDPHPRFEQRQTPAQGHHHRGPLRGLPSHREDRGSNCLTVAKESSALRTILPLVNHNQFVESVLDPSSQVIAMSEAACHALALIYNPRIHLRMQLANREVDETLGLARNVPILIGDITLYVQFHIVRNPAYDVLLGRPFDILVKSIVRNYSNEDQTITIHDPNS